MVVPLTTVVTCSVCVGFVAGAPVEIVELGEGVVVGLFGVPELIGGREPVEVIELAVRERPVEIPELIVV
jgi:hypothetical protein